MRIDRDLDVDRNDVNLILAGRGTFAAPDDPRDANKNGAIDVGDGRYCAVGCTRPGCAAN